MNPLFVPWDFVLILLFLGVVIPWRGHARLKRLMAMPEPASSDRLSLYVSTIIFQWLIAAVVAWRCAARSVGPDELGLSVEDMWRITWTSIALTGFLCLNQMAGLRRAAKLPAEKRGSLFAISERIMPRTTNETWVFAALACTAGISEEFLYRGFTLMAFVRILANYGPSNAGAAILSSAWFGLAHLYQGKRGMITTFVVGMIFAGVRLWTGSLIPAIAAHAGIDLVAGICTSRFFKRI